jgi:hypothetical protein
VHFFIIYPLSFRVKNNSDQHNCSISSFIPCWMTFDKSDMSMDCIFLMDEMKLKGENGKF